MTFSAHTFETNPDSESPCGFGFHQTLSEGQEIYFLAQFGADTSKPQSAAEEIFGAIVDQMETSSTKESYDKFEEALKAANGAVQKEHLGGNANIVVAFFDFHNLYLTQSGDAEAYLVRGKNVSQITEGGEDENDLFQNILSGQVAIDDTVVLSNNRLLRALTATQISDIFARGNFVDAVAMLRHELTSKSEEDTVVTAIGIGKQDEPSSAGFMSRLVDKKSTKKKAKDALPTDEVGEMNEEMKYESPFGTEDDPLDKEGSTLRLADVLSKGKKLLNKLPVRLPNLNSGILKKQKNMIIVAGTVAVVLLVGIGIRAISGIESAETQAMREELSIAKQAFQQADSLLLQGERKEASTYLGTAEESLQKILKSKSKVFRSDAQFLLADIQDKKLQVENARKVTPNLVADLGVKHDNLDSQSLLRLRGNLYVNDSKSVYKTVRNIVEKGVPVVNKESIVAAGIREDQGTLIYLTDAPKIVEFREGVISNMETADETWKGGIDIKTYGRFVYLLDPVENQIWKYERRRSNYSNVIAYSQGADLSRMVSMAIDGSIYLLGDDGTLQKLFRGQRVDYDFRELPSTPLQGNNLKLFTTPELDFLYVLDPDNQRILVFIKGDRFATYRKQVLFDIPKARDFVVDPSGQKVNVLTEDKIYEFSL